MASLLNQTFIMTRRSVTNLIREPAEVILPIVLGIFFLIIYEASLRGAAAVFLEGQSYLGFILPLSVISAALSGSGVAGQAIICDVQNGYFSKLLLTPVSRTALLLGPMLASALAQVVQAAVIILLALALGLRPVTGLPGLLVVLGFALILGLGLAGFVVGIALRTKSAGATGASSFLVFPLTFLAPVFTPLELLEGWIRVAAELNPLTYILIATRGLINTGWDVDALAAGLVVPVILVFVSLAFALNSLNYATRQR